MIQACLCLLAGVYALQLSSFTSYSDLLIVALVAAIASLLFRGLLFLAWFFAGVALFTLAAFQVVNSRIAQQFVGDSMLVKVRIIDFPQVTGPSASFIAEPVGDIRIPPRIRLSWYEPPVILRFGDVWQLELRLKRPRGNSNPGVFNYENWLFREHIGAAGYVVSGKRNHLQRSSVLNATDRLRQRFVDRLTTLLPGSDAAAVLGAISVGARHLMSAEQWERYARTGTSHLMAISGLHIGLAAGFAYVIARLLCGVAARRGNYHDIALLVSLLAAASYAHISGLEIPARRATLMIALIVTAILRRRQLSPVPIVSAACVVIVVFDPLATMAPGFKLSFAAVLVLLWLAHRYRESHTHHRWSLAQIAAGRSLATMQITLLLGLLPLTVLIFDRIAFAAPPVNFVAVPLFSFVTVPLALASLLLVGPLQQVGDQALLLSADSIRLLEWLIARSSSVATANVSIASVQGVAWLFIAMPLVQVLLPPGWPGRNAAWIAVVAIVLYKPAAVLPGCVDVEVLDVGQGLAAVVQTRGHVIVYDVGPAFRGGSSMGDRVVLPYLRSRGVNRVDRLLVSHADLDHAGGAGHLISGVDIGEILVGEALPNVGKISRPCTAGEHWHRDGVDFRIVHPPVGVRPDGNDASCVLIISAGEHRLLLTGDIEKPVEHALIRSGVLSLVDIVVVPHHGSRTSSSPPFVGALKPSLAIVSAGHDNRWGFPKEDVVSRWQAVGANVLETATSGAIGVRLCRSSGIVSVTRHRLREQRIWHEL